MSGDARDFNNIETRAVIKFFFLQGKAPKEIHAIPTETLPCFLPARAKDLSAPLYCGLVWVYSQATQQRSTLHVFQSGGLGNDRRGEKRELALKRNKKLRDI